ncbi:MAG: hypothetical protein ACSLFN_15690 [Candidatus Limnocylindrales bacterium]
MSEPRWLAIGARLLSILSWPVIVAVMVRLLSGGGTLTGVGYVLSTESPLALAFVAVTCIVAVTAVVAIARDRPGVWTYALKGALIALTSAVVLLVADHESALIAIAAASLALAIAIAMASLARRAT